MAFTASYLRSDDPVAGRIESDVANVVIVEERDVGNRAYPAPDVGFQKRSARAICPQFMQRTGLDGQVAAHVEMHLGQISIINGGCAGCDQFVDDSRKEFVQRLSTSQ